MAGIVYLDIDDEITSAADRIRRSADPRLALVVPPGSRLATSRINFRLLAREAIEHNRRLSIVAADAGSRALAASAGLPVFASVGEYEAAEAGSAGGAEASSAVAEGAVALEASETVVRPRAEPPEPAEPIEETPIVAATSVPQPADASPKPLPPLPPLPPPEASSRDRDQAHRVAAPEPDARQAPRFARLRRTGLAVAVALVALALLVTAVAGYVLLPSAAVVVTPRSEVVGPVRLTVTADPEAGAVDGAGRVIPALRLTFDVRAEGTFPATGKRVEQTRATGSVTFRSKDPTGTNAIASGSLVGTTGGVRFRTLAAVEIPRAKIVGLTIIPGEVSVRIEAVNTGPTGNVDANAITLIPQGEDPILTDVVNRVPTEGGSRTEFTLIVQADVDAATAQLRDELAANFAALAAAPPDVPAGATVFEETAELGPDSPSVEPAGLVGQEVESFDLGLTAEGAVTAVDPAPADAIGQTAVRTAVRNGYDLVAGSISVEVGLAAVEAGVVSYPVTATARQVRQADPDVLREAIRGKSLAEARSILEPYGDVSLSVWPDWVGSIPTFDFRLTVDVAAGPATDAGPTPSATASPAASPLGSGNP